MGFTNDYDITKEYRYICDELKSRRKYLRKTQEDVAFDLGFTAGYLSKVESGKKLTTSLQTFLTLSKYYEVDFGTIVKKANAKMQIDDSNFDN